MIKNLNDSLAIPIIVITSFLLVSVAVLVAYNFSAVSEDKLYDDYNTQSDIDKANQNIFMIFLELVSSLKVIFIAILGGILFIFPG